MVVVSTFDVDGEIAENRAGIIETLDSVIAELIEIVEKRAGINEILDSSPIELAATVENLEGSIDIEGFEILKVEVGVCKVKKAGCMVATADGKG